MKRAFFLFVMFTMLSFGSFAGDSGGVSENTQVWDGLKIFLWDTPVSTTASGHITLYNDSRNIQLIDANGAARNVTLPAPSNAHQGRRFKIVNTTSGAYSLTVKNAAASTIATVAQYQTGDFFWSGSAWVASVYTSSASGFVAADGTTTGATSQAQTFTNGVVLDAITGNTATPLAIAAKVGSTAVGNAITLTGGAGNGAFAGGAASLTGGASGAGATGAGGAASIVGGAAASTNGAGGAVAVTGGAGAGTGAGGAITGVAGASGAGATGNGGAATFTGGAATSTAGTGGAVGMTGGLGTTTGAGGAASLIGGVGGASGTGGAITITAGASAGAGGTAGAVAIDSGAATGGTGAGINIGTTNATEVLVGKLGATPATVQDVSTGGTITLPAASFVQRLTATAGAATGMILTAGTFDGQILTLINADATDTITFAAAGTSNVADGTSAAITALSAMTFVYDSTSSKWYRFK